jgi:hypothetical protein
MANEITITHRLQQLNGQFKHEHSPSTIRVTQTAPGYIDQIISVGTTEESISFGDLSTVGIVELVNMDATNYVEVGFSTGVYGDKLTAAKYIPHRYERNGSATFYVKANTAACKVRVIAYEA